MGTSPTAVAPGLAATPHLEHCPHTAHARRAAPKGRLRVRPKGRHPGPKGRTPGPKGPPHHHTQAGVCPPGVPLPQGRSWSCSGEGGDGACPGHAGRASMRRTHAGRCVAGTVCGVRGAVCGLHRTCGVTTRNYSGLWFMRSQVRIAPARVCGLCVCSPSPRKLLAPAPGRRSRLAPVRPRRPAAPAPAPRPPLGCPACLGTRVGRGLCPARGRLSKAVGHSMPACGRIPGGR